jgi:hypothetical protein
MTTTLHPTRSLQASLLVAAAVAVMAQRPARRRGPGGTPCRRAMRGGQSPYTERPYEMISTHLTSVVVPSAMSRPPAAPDCLLGGAGPGTHPWSNGGIEGATCGKPPRSLAGSVRLLPPYGQIVPPSPPAVEHGAIRQLGTVAPVLLTAYPNASKGRRSTPETRWPAPLQGRRAH